MRAPLRLLGCVRADHAFEFIGEVLQTPKFLLRLAQSCCCVPALPCERCETFIRVGADHVYQHVLPGMQAEAAGTLAALLSGFA